MNSQKRLGWLSMMDSSTKAQLGLLAVMGLAIIGALFFMNQLNSKMTGPKFQDANLAVYLTKKDTKEAREWLKSGNESNRKIIDSTGKGLTYVQWGALIENLYANGAKKVFFPSIMKDGPAEMTHGIFMELPDDPGQRKQIFSNAPVTWPIRSAPPQDAGQKYILVWFD